MVSSTWPTLIVSFLMLFLLTPIQSGQSQANEESICQKAYGAIQTEQAVPNWLQIDFTAEDLFTENRYDLLAGRLLYSGIADGSQCYGWGLNLDGSPNGCGLEKAQPAVNQWQNQFDGEILSAAQKLGYPPRLVKSVIAIESQFWPASDWSRGEVGLGQLTNAGADLLLSWRQEVYQDACSQVYGQETCQRPYGKQEPWIQAAIRGKLLRMADPSCAQCKGGVDIDVAKQSIPLLVEGLSASCQQSAYLTRRLTGSAPSSIMTYEDFMKLSLANYHAGSGCTTYALQNTFVHYDWGSLSGHYSVGCPNGTGYVRKIVKSLHP